MEKYKLIIVLAKELSLKGHVHDDRMKEYNHTAAEYMYASKVFNSVILV
jgi:hypothetical protein